MEKGQQGALLQPPVRVVRLVEEEQTGGGAAQVRNAPQRVRLARRALLLRRLLDQDPDRGPRPLDVLGPGAACI